MRRKIVFLFLLTSLIQQHYVAIAQEMKMAPKTKAEPVTETIHGVTITDPYRWLEDQESPATRAWIQEQNAYTQSLLGVRPERPVLKQRLEKLYKIDTQGVPIAKGGRYFFFKRRADQNQPGPYVRNGLNGKDEVLLDANGESADNTLSYSLQDLSEDGKMLVYGVRQGGKDEVQVKFMDVDR